LDRAPHARHVPALDLAEAEAAAAPEEAVARGLPQRLRLREECAALAGEVVDRILEPAVELRVVRRTEALRLAMDDLVLADVQLVVLLRRLVAGPLEPLALGTVFGIHRA